MTSFVHNSWYMAAWSDEVSSQRCLSRTILDRPMAFYRAASGAVVALQDRCPHRFAPLSLGRIKNDLLECPYHGLTFDHTGKCVRNPQGEPPPGARVKAYPTTEKHGMVWVWPGEPDQAQAAALPDFPLRADPRFRSVNGMTHLKVNYQLILDNLLDLTHITYLHPGFGGDDWQPHNEVDQQEHSVSSTYTVLDFPANEYTQTYFPELPARVDERDTMNWYPASICRFDILLAEVGQLERSERRVEDAHILTPETASTTHYFWSSTFSRSTTTSDDTIVALLNQAFENEDKPMLERLQRVMGDREFWSLRPVLLKGDNAAVRVRRMLDNLLKGDSGADESGKRF